MKTTKRISLVGLFCLLLTLHTHAQEWPRFRGPDGAGVGKAPNVPTAFTEKDYAWNVKLPGRGHASPVLWGQRVFVTCDQGKQRGIVCVDAATGKAEWTWWTPYEPIHNHPDNSYAAATPAADAERVYLSWVDGGRVVALALDHAGKKLWQRDLGAFQARHGAGGSPMLVGDVLIVPNASQIEGAAIHGLDAATGKTRWRLPREVAWPSYATPATYRDEEGQTRVLLVSPAHGFSGIDPANGKELWRKGGLFTLNVVASPVYADGVVIGTAGKGGQREGAVVSFRDNNPRRLYEPGPRRALPYVPTPIALGGLVYLWSDYGTVTCLELATGKLVWQKRVTGPTYTSPVSDGKRIFGISRKGEVVVFAPGTKYKELGRSQLPEGTHATPAIAHGAMFIRTFGRLIRVGK